VETVDSPLTAAWSSGVQLHDSGPGDVMLLGVALVLIYSHANAEKAKACINAMTYLKNFHMNRSVKKDLNTIEILR